MAHRSFNRAAQRPLAIFVLTSLAIGIVWAWLGVPTALPPLPSAAGHTLSCVSYAPFRDNQDPLVEGTMVSSAQIEQDLALLSRYTNCIRTYSVDSGLDKVPAIAQRYGLRVLLGLWLSNNPQKNQQQIETAVTLAHQFADVVTAVVVGNEVLLRGEMSATDLMVTLRAVKSQITQPVTYADVWEFWLRYPDVQNAVDFVTIHILPYWEDFPLPATLAASHVEAIHARVAAAIPNKEILVGEFGWPSAGRMREGARPSPWNQAFAIQQTLAIAQRDKFRVNVIEAFDQPWKRWLEGPTGAYWGIFSRATNGPKFVFGGSVSDHPHWLILATAGIILAGATFAGAAVVRREEGSASLNWTFVAVMVFLPAVLFGWTLELVPVDSYTFGGWLRSLVTAGVAGAAPIVCAAAYAAGVRRPTFAAMLARMGPHRPLVWGLGFCFLVVVLISVQHALGLVFDPRYRDIPFAPITGAVVPFLALAWATPGNPGARAVAETAAAIVLLLSAAYILLNESFANWQAVWFCAALAILAFILAWRERVAPD